VQFLDKRQVVNSLELLKEKEKLETKIIQEKNLHQKQFLLWLLKEE